MMVPAQRLRSRLVLLLDSNKRKINSTIGRIKEVPKWIKQAVIISIAARAVTFASVLVNWALPEWANKKIDPFWCPGYSHSMYAAWWVYYFSQNIAWLLASYVTCQISARISNYLFLVMLILLSYQIFDFVMYLWNFNKYILLYADMLWTAMALSWSVFKGYQPETIAKIKSLF